MSILFSSLICQQHFKSNYSHIEQTPVFGFPKANLGFTRMSVRGKSKVHNELGFALMGVNIRKYSAINNENGTFSQVDMRKNSCVYLLLINTTVFVYLRLVMFHPLYPTSNWQ